MARTCAGTTILAKTSHGLLRDVHLTLSFQGRDDMLALIAAGGSSLLVPTVGRTPVRHGALRMQAGMLPTGGSDLEANNDQGNTFWATLDGRDKDGISPDGMVPPGDDLIETDLKRVFSIDPDEEGMAGDSGFSDMDEVQVRRRQPHTAGSPTHRQAESSGATLSRNPLTGLPAQPLTQAPIRPPAHPARRPAAAHVQAAQGAGRDRLQQDIQQR